MNTSGTTRCMYRIDYYIVNITSMTNETYNQIHYIHLERCDELCILYTSLPHGSGEYFVSVMTVPDILSFLPGM